MPELENLIGVRLIRLLKVIVGPPITINLRNILWHGFVNCSGQIIDQSNNLPIEVDLLRFYYFLLAISISIGDELQKSDALQLLKIDSAKEESLKLSIIECIPQRKLYNFDEFVLKLESIFPILDSEFVNEAYLRFGAMFDLKC